MLREILEDQLGVDLAEITPEAKIQDDLGADSLDCIELVMRLEDDFGIEIPDEDVDKAVNDRAATVQGLADYLTAKLNAIRPMPAAGDR